jgi:tetratricopeptide (TPR) repeat protein
MGRSPGDKSDVPLALRVLRFFDPARPGFIRRMLKLGFLGFLISGCVLSLVAVRLAQTNPGKLTIAIALNMTGQYDAAERITRELIAEDPGGNITYYEELARSLRHKGEIEAQLAVLDTAVEVLPSNWVGHSQRCWYYALYHRPGEAMHSCDLAIEYAPESGFAHARRGVARALLGDREGAIEDIEDGLHMWAVSPTGYVPPQPWETWLEQLKAGQDPFDEETLQVERDRF